MQVKICNICHIEQGLDEFMKDKYTVDGLQPECISCVERLQEKFYDEHGYPAKIAKKHSYKQNSKQKIHVRFRKWLKFIQKRNLSCEHCGYDKYFSVLQFHHRDPSKKKYMISTLMRLAFTEENQQRMINELMKCDVLCANCHIELHEDIKRESI